MIPIDTIALFLPIVVGLGLIPGPDNIFVLIQSVLHGRIAGLIVTLGLCTGLIFHTVIVALGVTVIFHTSSLAINALKIVGTIYLFYLGWQAFRATVKEINVDKEKPKNCLELYLRGVIMNITNPKVAIFFLAFFPQFTDPNIGPVSIQVFILGALFIAVTLVVFGSVVWTAGLLSRLLKTSIRVQVIMNKIAGVVFVGLAIKLATTQL